MKKIGNEKLLELYVNEMIEISNNRAISQSSRFELLKMEKAAPAMYDALKIALRIIEAEKEACGIYKEHTEKIRAALAAAEGRK